MIKYKNHIEINKPRKLVFDYLTIPAYWTEYLPCTIDVKPVIKGEFLVGKQVIERLNILGSKSQVQWTCTTNDNLSIFEIDGISRNFGGSSSRLSYKITEENGVSEVERNVSFKQNNLLMRIIEPALIPYFIFEAKKGLKKAKSIIESMSHNKSLEQTA